jgi:hypothetical protein
MQLKIKLIHPLILQQNHLMEMQVQLEMQLMSDPISRRVRLIELLMKLKMQLIFLLIEL